MKKLIVFIILVAALFALYFSLKQGKENKVKKDYKKIEDVKSAVEEVISSGALSSFSNQGQWYIFDLRVLKENDEGFYRELARKLGKDFDTRLSNGDYLFVGVLPYTGSFRIYAGDPAESDTMLYPEWKYKKLKEK